jgi:hypothetical protein
MAKICPVLNRICAWAVINFYLFDSICAAGVRFLVRFSHIAISGRHKNPFHAVEFSYNLYHKKTKQSFKTQAAHSHSLSCTQFSVVCACCLEPLLLWVSFFGYVIGLFVCCDVSKFHIASNVAVLPIDFFLAGISLFCAPSRQRDAIC